MDVQAVLRLGLCALAAALSAGCLGTRTDGSGRPFFMPFSNLTGTSDKSATTSTDNATTTFGSKPSAGGVAPAGGLMMPLSPAGQPPGPMLPPQPPSGTQPAGPTGTGPPSGSSSPGGAALPGNPSTGGTAMQGTWMGGTSAPFGPHVRTAPTATGSLLNLGPGEIAADRVVELAKLLEAAGVENRALVGRIRDLEASGIGREQALTEALREVEAASAEVGRARADLAVLRKEIVALKDRLEQVEKEDVETLKAVIAALDKLVQGAPLGRPAGKELP